MEPCRAVGMPENPWGHVGEFDGQVNSENYVPARYPSRTIKSARSPSEADLGCDFFVQLKNDFFALSVALNTKNTRISLS